MLVVEVTFALASESETQKYLLTLYAPMSVDVQQRVKMETAMEKMVS